jgi:hypothetical protein
VFESVIADLLRGRMKLRLGAKRLRRPPYPGARKPSIGAHRLEPRARDLVGQRKPSVAVAYEQEEVGARRDGLAAGDLVEADARGALTRRGLVADVPPEVDCLERAATLGAALTQLREHPLPQGVSLGFEVGEGRRDGPGRPDWPAPCPVPLATYPCRNWLSRLESAGENRDEPLTGRFSWGLSSATTAGVCQTGCGRRPSPCCQRRRRTPWAVTGRGSPTAGSWTPSHWCRAPVCSGTPWRPPAPASPALPTAASGSGSGPASSRDLASRPARLR